ncbi:MAG: flippase-like domain-containing protein [Thermoplasmata archaeon]|nr:flippase-like domain-containing protein [Thermoplasmata archaeon]
MEVRPVHVLLAAVSVLAMASVVLAQGAGEVAHEMQRASLPFLCLVVALYLLNVVIKAFRWYLLVNAGGALPFRRALPYQIVAVALNNMVPGKVAGEPFRVGLLRTSDGHPLTAGVATVVWEKGFDVIVIVLMALVGLALVSGDLAPSVRWALLSASLVMLCLAAIPLALLVRGRLASVAARLLGRLNGPIGSDLLGRRLPAVARDFEDGFVLLHRERLVLPTLALTVLIWTIDVANFLIIYELVLPGSGGIGLGAVLLAVATATLLSIPLSAGGGNVLGLTSVLVALDLPRERVVAASLLAVATSVWLGFALGAAVMAGLLAGEAMGKREA